MKMAKIAIFKMPLHHDKIFLRKHLRLAEKNTLHACMLIDPHSDNHGQKC